jgi:hypothetical protein
MKLHQKICRSGLPTTIIVRHLCEKRYNYGGDK